MTTVRYSSHFDATPEALFAFHMDVANLARISPPLPRFELLSEPGTTSEGDEQRFRLSLGPLGTEWVARIVKVVPGAAIEDVQAEGPFRSWRHRHAVAADGSGSQLTDTVRFRLIPTAAGAFLEFYLVRPGLWCMFAWRHRCTRQLLEQRAT